MQARKAKKNLNDNTTTSPAPEQPAVQQEASSFKQKLAMTSDVISGHVNIPQNEPVQNNKEDYSPLNPPVVVLTDGTNISMCKGCKKKLQKNRGNTPTIIHSQQTLSKYFYLLCAILNPLRYPFILT